VQGIQNVFNVLCAVITVWNISNLALHRWQAHVYRRVKSWLNLVFVVLSCLLAMCSFALGEWFTGVWFAALAAIVGYSWWNDDDTKRRRRKLASRVAGRVIDLGGRLGVVRPAEG
jgi:hypothetical protein